MASWAGCGYHSNGTLNYPCTIGCTPLVNVLFFLVELKDKYNSVCTVPGSKSSCSEAQKDRPDQLTKTCCVNSINFVGLTVLKVVTVQGAARQTDPLSGLVIIQ